MDFKSPEDSLETAERKFRNICAQVINKNPIKAAKKKLFSNEKVKTALRPSMIDRACSKRKFISSTPMVRDKTKPFISDEFDNDVSSIDSLSEQQRKLPSIRKMKGSLIDLQKSTDLSLSSTQSSEKGKSISKQQHSLNLKDDASKLERLNRVVEKIAQTAILNTTNKNIQTSKNNITIRDRSRTSAKALVLKNLKEGEAQTGASLQRSYGEHTFEGLSDASLGIKNLSQNRESVRSVSPGASSNSSVMAGVENFTTKSINGKRIERKIRDIDSGAPWRAPSGLESAINEKFLSAIEDSSGESLDDTFRPKIKKKKSVFTNKKKIRGKTTANGGKDNRNQPEKPIAGTLKIVKTNQNRSRLDTSSQQQQNDDLTNGFEAVSNSTFNGEGIVAIQVDENENDCEQANEHGENLDQTVTSEFSKTRNRSHESSLKRQPKSRRSKQPAENSLRIECDELRNGGTITPTLARCEGVAPDLHQSITNTRRRRKNTQSNQTFAKDGSKHLSEDSLRIESEELRGGDTITGNKSRVSQQSTDQIIQHEIKGITNKNEKNPQKKQHCPSLSRCDEVPPNLHQSVTNTGRRRKNTENNQTSAKGDESTGLVRRSGRERRPPRRPTNCIVICGSQASLKKYKRQFSSQNSSQKYSLSSRKMKSVTNVGSAIQEEDEIDSMTCDGQGIVKVREKDRKSAKTSRKKKVDSMLNDQNALNMASTIQEEVGETDLVPHHYDDEVIPTVSTNHSSPANIPKKASDERIDSSVQEKSAGTDFLSDEIMGPTSKNRVRSGKILKRKCSLKKIRKSMRNTIDQPEHLSKLFQDKSDTFSRYLVRDSQIQYEEVKGIKGLSSAVQNGSLMGFLKLEVGSTKPMQKAVNHAISFTVLEGQAHIGVENEEFVCIPFNLISVPSGTQYFIKNASDHQPLVLVFSKFPRLSQEQ